MCLASSICYTALYVCPFYCLLAVWQYIYRKNNAPMIVYAQDWLGYVVVIQEFMNCFSFFCNEYKGSLIGISTKVYIILSDMGILTIFIPLIHEYNACKFSHEFVIFCTTTLWCFRGQTLWFCLFLRILWFLMLLYMNSLHIF